jgi:lysine-specific demethylase 8
MQRGLYPRLHHIPRIVAPSPDAFRDFFLREEPVIITGAIEGWAARNDKQGWHDLESIKARFGGCSVPLEVGGTYNSAGFRRRHLPLGDYISLYIEQNLSPIEAIEAQAVQHGQGRRWCPNLSLEEARVRMQSPAPARYGYMAQFDLLDELPGLKEGVLLPQYLHGADVDVYACNTWLGHSHTVSPLHYDPNHNLLAQVLGSKYVRLYCPSLAPLLYPHVHFSMRNTSQVDVERPDIARFPLFPCPPVAEPVTQPIYPPPPPPPPTPPPPSRPLAPPPWASLPPPPFATTAPRPAAPPRRCGAVFEGVLNEGEVLYIPLRYWHFVKALSRSWSVNFWFR